MTVPPVYLDATKKQDVKYCLDLGLRDEHIKLAIARPVARLQGRDPKATRPEPLAIAGFGPSLADTWEKLRGFPYLMTCSGAHRFLVERGLVPTWHVEVDPRPHKVQLIGPPHPDVEYLIASTCHPAVFDHLAGARVTLWHVFDHAEEFQRVLPPGEWGLTGGVSVGLRTMTLARFLGFTELHVFGMDGSYGTEAEGTPTGTHAAPHPNHVKAGYSLCVYDGVTYRTNPAMLEAARQTAHELDMMPDVRATFYGEGLVQHLLRDYTPTPPPKGQATIAAQKALLITPEYAALNAQLHRTVPAYGVGGGKHAGMVLKLADQLKTRAILDYGCGKGTLAKAIPFPIWEYDPAIPGKDASPRPADLVVCTDVLEHIEPPHLLAVLDDLRRCVRQVGYFTIHTGPAAKVLPDGRNTHLIQRPRDWWARMLGTFFHVGRIWTVGPELIVVVGPKPRKGA